MRFMEPLLTIMLDDADRTGVHSADSGRSRNRDRLCYNDIARQRVRNRLPILKCLAFGRRAFFVSCKAKRKAKSVDKASKKAFIKRADLLVNDLSDGRTAIRDVINRIQDLESLRQLVFQDGEPGCSLTLFPPVAGCRLPLAPLWRLETRHPRNIDDRRQADFSFDELSPDDSEELKTEILAIIKAWAIEAGPESPPPNLEIVREDTNGAKSETL